MCIRDRLRQSDREVAVASLLRIKDLDVMRTVHWLEQVAFDLAVLHFIGQLAATASFLGQLAQVVPVDQRGILALLVIRKVAACFVEIQFSDVRSEYLIVPLAKQMLRNKVLQLLADE